MSNRLRREYPQFRKDDTALGRGNSVFLGVLDRFHDTCQLELISPDRFTEDRMCLLDYLPEGAIPIATRQEGNRLASPSG